ncbi:efflux transporter outer membrane subunit [Desulforhabdus amnigena]|uniref:efflux transporter outer membrane subunit n=1 Tax=Desulforhabdus amnigena TaxID=40218 RepID=UPI0024928CEF|nr:efflux transporter outer membrane subunit [Desulforhabdus amnigena]
MMGGLLPLRRILPALLVVWSLLVSIGCTVGPNYVEPKMEVPEKFSEVSQGEAAPEPVDLSRWWTIFKDPRLDGLIEQAIQSNKDLKVAEARVREARAFRGVVAADAYPQITASGSYTRIRRSENQSPSASAFQAGNTGGNNEQDLFDAGFDASWEIDIFGGIRRSVEAAEADIGASEENLHDVLVSLLAEVARNYIQLRGDQLRIAIASENIDSQRKTLELTQERFAAGLSSQLDVTQARAQLAVTESEIPRLESSARQAIHQIGVLLGREPGALLDELLTEAPVPTGPPEVPVGLPSELLRRRPDVRKAERELAAATARIGVATADLFPKFFLTGSVGQQSVNFSDIALPESRFWSFGPTISWPVFSGGRIRANIRVENARQEQAAERYEQTVLNALKDVEDALVAYAKEQKTRRFLKESVDATRLAVDISNELYSGGLVDFLNVLVNERSLFQTQDSLAQSEQIVSSNLVALFKALGGGWDVSMY